MDLEHAQVRISVPPGVPSSAVTRSDVEKALHGRRVKQGEAVAWTAPLSLPLLVEKAVPREGIVTRTTRLEIVTELATGKPAAPEPRPEFFVQFLAPDEALRSEWDAVHGEVVKEKLVRNVGKLLRHERVLATIGRRLGIGGRYLLDGPPGTGKTSIGKGLADAVARRYGIRVRLLVVKGSSIFSRYVGESAKNMQALFEAIRARAGEFDLTVVLLDEYDGLATARTNEQEHPDARKAVNVFLIELEQLTVYADRTVVIACSNISHQTDEAALSRFDKIYSLALPDARARSEMLWSKLDDVRREARDMRVCVSASELRRVAKATAGYSGRDLAHLVGEAFLLADDNRNRLDGSCLSQALREIKPPKVALKVR